MHQRLKLVRKGQRQECSNSVPLRHGAEGNEQTLRYAAAWVREDSSNDDRIRDLATDLVSRCAFREAQCEVTQLFEFVRDQIRYVEDPIDTERIADAWRTVETKAGDCIDKVILLATLLGSIGYPSEIVTQDFEGDLSNGFSHGFLSVLVDGRAVDLDPTPEWSLVGWRAPAIYEAVFPIWDSNDAGMAGLFDSLLQTGIQLGGSYAQNAIQQSRASSSQNAAIEGEWNQLIAEALAIFQSLSALPNVAADEVNYAAAVIAAIEQWLGQNGTERVRQQWNDPSYKPAFTHSLNVLQTRAVSAGQSSVVSGQSQTADGSVLPAVAGGWLDSPYVPIALVIAAALLLKSRRE